MATFFIFPENKSLIEENAVLCYTEFIPQIPYGSRLHGGLYTPLPQKGAPMEAEQRRQNILTLLAESKGPLSATALAGRFSVSRQIIVGDVALLRAAGNDIAATPRGYLMAGQQPADKLCRRIACRHEGTEMQAELYAMVDEGCTVKDVIVEHPLYGQLTGLLELTSRHDVDEFIHRGKNTKPLSLLTSGIHLHTLLCPDEAAFQRVSERLSALGVLYREDH